MPPIDLISVLVNDQLTWRGDRFVLRRVKQAEFRDPNKTLDGFDLDFNKKMNRKLIFDLATGQFVDRHEDALFLGPPGTGKSHPPKRSVEPSSRPKDTASFTARLTISSRSSPTRPSLEIARGTLSGWPPSRCSSSMTLG
jgi:hypothetical protein